MFHFSPTITLPLSFFTRERAFLSKVKRAGKQPHRKREGDGCGGDGRQALEDERGSTEKAVWLEGRA